MHIRFIFLTFLFFCTKISIAQSILMEIPIKQKVSIGEMVHIPLQVHDIKKYQINMEGQPADAILDENVFTWKANGSKKNYLIKFKLLDSAKTLVDETSLALTVELADTKPYLVLDRNLPDTIKLTENETFAFTASIKSKQNTDPAAVKSYFLFNENPNLRNFDSCRISVIGDQLSFSWTPSDKEALQEYLKFRITLVDADQSIMSQVFNFRIKNVNQKPYFVHDIPDTIYLQSDLLMLDFAAIDPDHDKLKYNYSPKGPGYSLQGSTIIFKPDNMNAVNSNSPLHLTMTASDNKNTIKHDVTIIRNAAGARTNQLYFQPVIGDFTKKIFSEGDSVLTYLNISNYNDLKNLDITYSDLTLPLGINSLTRHLIFEKESSYIKIYSKGILPYSLVDRDYNYNISVSITSKDPLIKPSFRVLVLTIENRVDPKNIIQQKDTLVKMVNNFLFTENIYKSNLTKIRNRINRPWWKKVALVTGTLSGVLTLIQSQQSNKTIAAISASISLLSITITSLPSLSEKALSLVDEKIANSKSRTQQVLDKESQFLSEWSIYLDQSDLDKIRSETEDLIDKYNSKRKDEVCALLLNKKVKRKIAKLIKRSSEKDKVSSSVESIFQCGADK